MCGPDGTLRGVATGVRQGATGLLGRGVVRLADPTVARTLAIGLAGLVVAYGALLRFDAIAQKYGPVDRPAWLHGLQQARASSSLLRPAGVRWDPVPTFAHSDGPPTHYRGDPYTYLQYARQMHAFYDAHRREPLFPFVTKIFLALLAQQDVAVSFASAAFSLLAIVATFLLGWYACSYWVGLGAALAMAIEYDVISWGVEGWRDDAFTCGVLLFALALLRYWRNPSRWNAVLMGSLGGLSCLVRITSLSFVLPGLACLLFMTKQPWRARLGGVGLSVLVATTIVAPFLINCWRTFGDPLYAIDVHADIYRAADRRAVQATPTVAQYLHGQVRGRPIRTLDTALLGMTSYPFVNKWRGFEPWMPSAGRWLSWAALVGLLLFLGSPTGRLLLVVLASSLVPYAVTWRLISDWRFTEHAYPLFLIAAGSAIVQAVALASPSRIQTLARRMAEPRRLILSGAVLGTLGLGGWVVMRVLPVLVVCESLGQNEAVTIAAGDRDGSFFTEGWSRPHTEGSVTKRASQGDHSAIRIPLPRAQDYDLTLRLDPFPPPRDTHAPLPAIRVFLNGQAVAHLDLQWTPERVGAYLIHVPRSMTKRGFNDLVLLVEANPGGTTRFSAWYVRVRHPVS